MNPKFSRKNIDINKNLWQEINLLPIVIPAKPWFSFFKSIIILFFVVCFMGYYLYFHKDSVAGYSDNNGVVDDFQLDLLQSQYQLKKNQLKIYDKYFSDTYSSYGIYTLFFSYPEYFLKIEEVSLFQSKGDIDIQLSGYSAGHQDSMDYLRALKNSALIPSSALTQARFYRARKDNKYSDAYYYWDFN